MEILKKRLYSYIVFLILGNSQLYMNCDYDVFFLLLFFLDLAPLGGVTLVFYINGGHKLLMSFPNSVVVLQVLKDRQNLATSTMCAEGTSDLNEINRQS